MVTKREKVQAVLAKCYVAMAEADWELAQWRKEMRRGT